MLDSVHLAQRKAVAQAVNDAVTIVDATVSAAAASSVTIILADGTSIPNVPVVQGYVTRVGDSVRVAVTGNRMLVLGANAVPTAVEGIGQSASSWSVTATSLTTLSPIHSAAFVAPSNGAVIVHLKARLTPTATARALASLRIVRVSDGAQVATYANPLIEVPAGAGTFSLGASFLFQGLNPGTSYRAEVTAASGTAGQTVTLSFPTVVVQPCL